MKMTNTSKPLPREVQSASREEVLNSCTLADTSPFFESPYYKWLQSNEDLECVKVGRFVDCFTLFAGEHLSAVQGLIKHTISQSPWQPELVHSKIKWTLESYWRDHQKDRARRKVEKENERLKA